MHTRTHRFGTVHSNAGIAIWLTYAFLTGQQIIGFPLAAIGRPVLPQSQAGSTPASLPIKVEALCSLYSKYEVCHPVVDKSRISGNFPTEYLQLDASDIEGIDIYDARRIEFNYVLGTASTIIFGPYGLLGFLAMRKVGDVDFGIRYRDGSKKRTAFIRFKNNASVAKFGEAIKPLLMEIQAKQPPEGKL